jgi:hypothetical protein
MPGPETGAGRCRDIAGGQSAAPVPAGTRKVVDGLREYRAWRGMRDSLVKAALAAGIPVHRICEESGLHKDTVCRIKDGHR